MAKSSHLVPVVSSKPLVATSQKPPMPLFSPAAVTMPRWSSVVSMGVMLLRPPVAWPVNWTVRGAAPIAGVAAAVAASGGPMLIVMMLVPL